MPKLTRAQREKRKVYNRIKKRESRARLSQRKLVAVQEYDRKRMRAKRAKLAKAQIKKMGHSGEVNDVYTNKDGFSLTYYSPAALRQASLRLRKKFPQSPAKYVQLLNHINMQTKKSPRKRKILDTAKAGKGVGKGEGKVLFRKLKKLQKAKSGQRKQFIQKQILAKYKSRRQASRKLGIRWKVLQKMCSISKMEEDFLHEKENENIVNFYYRPDISINLPDKKYAGTHYMNRSIKDAHKKYEELYGQTPFSSFAKKRPKKVKPMAMTPQRQCICEVCANFGLALAALSKCGIQYTKDERSAVNESLCDRQRRVFHRLYKLCTKSMQDVWYPKGKGKLKSHIDKKTSCSWQRWVYTPSEKGRKLILATVTGTCAQLINIYITDLDKMAEHLFNADFQHHQFINVRDNIDGLQDGTVLEVLDFAQNYLCYYQDEPQECHWDHSQVTIHPIVCYFKGSCGHLITEELVFISPDLKHNASAVEHFTNVAEKHLAKKLPRLHKIIQFTDQCPAQYKSKTPFFDISKREVMTERHYFGARHGKGPADGVTGRVKKAVSVAVKSRKVVINDAESFYKYCKDELETKATQQCQHHRMFFFHAPNIVRTEQMELNTVQGTRLIHSVRSTGKVGVIEIRNLSCTCIACLSDRKEGCISKDFVKDWSRVTMLKPKSTEVELKVSIPKSKSTKSKLAKVQKKEGSSKENNPPKRRDAASYSSMTGTKKRKFEEDSSESTCMRKLRSTTSQSAKRSFDNKIPQIVHSSEKRKLLVDSSTNRGSSTPKGRGSSDQPKTRNCVTGSKRKRQKSWSIIQASFNNCKSYAELEDYVNTHIGPPLPKHKPLSVPTAKLDPVAMELLHQLPAPVNDLLPVAVYGDGNCFPRALSMLFYGNQYHMHEMRGRIVYEGVLHKGRYLNDTYLSMGAAKVYKRVGMSTILAQFSANYTIGEPVETTFEKELLEVSKMGSYCGLWEFPMAADVFNVSVVSHYPSLTPSLGLDMNRKFYPFENSEPQGPTFNILWSYTDLNNSKSPNHFVPLRSVTKKSGEEKPKSVTGLRPMTKGPKAGKEGPTSREEGPTARQDGPNPKENGPPPGEDGPTPGEDGPTAKEEGPTPWEQGPTPREDGPTAKEDGPTPGEDGPSPGEDGPTARVEGPTPWEQGPTPGGMDPQPRRMAPHLGRMDPHLGRMDPQPG